MVELFSASYLELKQQLLEGELDIILTFRHDLQEQPDILFRPLREIPTYSPITGMRWTWSGCSEEISF